MNLTKNFHSKLALTFLIAVSVFGLVLSNFFVVSPFTGEEKAVFRNITAASAFGLLCILGIFAALFPNLRKITSKQKDEARYSSHNCEINEINFIAHHPSCRNFSSHVLKVGNKEFCATCSGLLVGAALALLGTVLWFSWNFQIGETFKLVLVGSIAVSLGLLQSTLSRLSNGIIRFFGNIVFVLGAFLMFVSINEASQSILIDFFFIALSLLWIMTKIALSQNDHQQVCSECSRFSCRYYYK
jgi:hypothetical protein